MEVAADLGCRLLLVEDNDAVAQATRDLLMSMGCEVLRVASGSAALDLLAAQPERFDIVLSDIEMPGELDGIALAVLLRSRQPSLPVLLMTGYAARLEQAVRQQLDVLPKPCSPAVLAEAIGRALSRRRTAAMPAAEA
jgi:CheY-like chemotaxis protein